MGALQYVYSVFAGTLPAGLTLNSSTGIVSGTPTAAGAFNYSIRVTDNASTTADVAVSGTIASSVALSITATPSSATKVGVTYLQTNTASGGTAPYVYSVSAGTLPAGLALNSTTGIVSGNPTTAGAFSYTITVTDSLSATASTTTSGTIASATTLTLAANSSVNLQVGLLYVQANIAAGGSAPYVFSLDSGTLPAGLTLDSTTGVVIGTPTNPGPFSYTIKVTDNLGASATVNVNATIAALNALTITATPSSNTQVGVSYFQANTASGGVTPYTYSVASGTLPAGVTLNTTNGIVSGTPTTAGAFSYTIRVTDGLSFTANATSSGTIASATALTLTASPSSSTQVGVSYLQTNTASGGTSPYTFSVVAGALPAGVTLDTSTGIVTGTPSTAGSFSYTIRVTDSLSVTANATSSGVIASATALTISATPSNNTQVGVSYLQANTASGGTAPYTFSVVSGSLPAGVSLNTSTGIVSGTPTTTGAFSYTIRVTDALSATASVTTTGTIAATGALVLTSTPSSETKVGSSYLQTNTATGGTSPYTYSLIAGSLPNGLILDASTGIVYGTPTSAGSFSYTIRVTDNLGATANTTVSGIIASATALSITSTASATIQVGVAYSQTNIARGGTAPYVYSIASGTLPAGVTLNTTTGTVSGTPTSAGAFSYTIRVTDNVGTTATRTVSGSVVQAGGLVVLKGISTFAQVGMTYSQSNPASGGTPPYVYSLVAGALPNGVALNTSTGMVSGVPTTSGAFTYTIRVTDSLGASVDFVTSGFILLLPTNNLPDPAALSNVQGIVAAQSLTAIHLTKVQSDNIWTHIHKLHSKFGTKAKKHPGGINMRFFSPQQVLSGAQDYWKRAVDGVNTLILEPLLLDELPIDVWVGGSIEYGSIKDELTKSRNDFNTSGLTFGVDVIRENLTYGLAIGYGSGKNDVKRADMSNDSSEILGSGYVTYQPWEDWFFDTLVGYGHLSSSSKRWSDLDQIQLSGERKGYVLYGSFAVNNQIRLRELELIPYVRADLYQYNLDKFAESGGVYTLNYHKTDFSSKSLATGLTMSQNIKLTSKTKLNPSIKLQYKYTADANVNQQISYVNFVSADNYFMNGSIMPTNTGSLGLGLKYDVSPFIFDIDWLGSIGNNSYWSNRIDARIRAVF